MYCRQKCKKIADIVKNYWADKSKFSYYIKTFKIKTKFVLCFKHLAHFRLIVYSIQIICVSESSSNIAKKNTAVYFVFTSDAKTLRGYLKRSRFVSKQNWFLCGGSQQLFCLVVH